MAADSPSSTRLTPAPAEPIYLHMQLGRLFDLCVCSVGHCCSKRERKKPTEQGLNAIRPSHNNLLVSATPACVVESRLMVT